MFWQTMTSSQPKYLKRAVIERIFVIEPTAKTLITEAASNVHWSGLRPSGALHQSPAAADWPASMPSMRRSGAVGTTFRRPIWIIGRSPLLAAL